MYICDHTEKKFIYHLLFQRKIYSKADLVEYVARNSNHLLKNYLTLMF